MSSKKKCFYTDGACSGNPGAGGWCCIEVNIENGLETKIMTGGKKETTNNEMELTAAYTALVKSYKDGAKEVTIYSDSAYVVNAVKKGWLKNWHSNGWQTKENKPIKNMEIWKKAYKLIYEKGMDVNMVWVKGHNDNPLNELADKKAVEARQKAMEG